MHVLEFFSVLRKRWLYVLIPAILGTGIAGFLSATTTPIYQASSSVYFSLPYGASASDLFQGTNYTQKQLASYATLATLPVVLQPVITQLGLGLTPNQLAGQVQAVASEDTVIIEIKVNSPSPTNAANISNAVAAELSKQVQELSPKSADGAPSVEVSVVAAAVPPEYPFTPNTRRNVAVGAVAGLFVGIVLALARDRLDTRVRSPRDLPRGLTLLATVPFDKQAKRSPLITDTSVRSSRTEIFRTLRTNLQFVNVGKPSKVIVVTSSLPGEGKTSTAVNLGIVFADAGKRVLIMDGDLRRPQVADYLSVEGEVGLSNVLAGQVDARDAIQPWGATRLSILASGSIPPNPSELLGSRPMHELVTSMRGRFDYIIIDAPPLLPVTDAAVMSSLADGVVFVVRSGSTKRNQVATAFRALGAVDARILGAVLNMAPVKGSDGVSHYGYGAYSSHDPATSTSGKVASDSPISSEPSANAKAMTSSSTPWEDVVGSPGTGSDGRAGSRQRPRTRLHKPDL